MPFECPIAKLLLRFKNKPAKYGLALVAFLVSLLLRFAIGMWGMNDRDFILFIPGVILTMAIGGLGPGVLVAGLSGFAMWYFFLPPYDSFALGLDAATGLLQYILVIGIIITLLNWLQNAVVQLRSFSLQLEEKNRLHEELAKREKLLTAELQHRTQNMFAVIHGLAARSFDGARDISVARAAFMGRLIALSRANQRLLTPGAGSIEHLVHEELKPFLSKVHLEGPDLMLDDKTAQSFVLVLHELMTNAAKYGALSNLTGHVDVAWAINGPSTLLFSWKEVGGPEVKAPTRQGFGTGLLRSGLGMATLNYEANGLQYNAEIQLPFNPDSGKTFCPKSRSSPLH